MANMTDALELALLDGLTSVTQYTSPAIVYLALFTADPTDTGSVANEVSGTSYARVSLATKFTAATGTTGVSANTSAITFAAAGAGGWGTITHIGFMESGTATTADMMMHSVLTDPITIVETDVFEFLTGGLTVTLA